MPSGTILLSWDATGKLSIKASLPVTETNKKLWIQVLLDAAKAVNDASNTLVLPSAAPTQILAG